MAPALAAKHPEITSYAGTGIDDPTANIRADLTPLGFHASIRSAHGNWYVEPASVTNQATYVSYFGRDLKNAHGTFVEREAGGLAEDTREPRRRDAGDQHRRRSSAPTGSPSSATRRTRPTSVPTTSRRPRSS